VSPPAPFRAVWSFWTRPYQDASGPRWGSHEAHLLSWALSFLTARAHYSRTVLITDTDGADLLCDRLGLEFGEVSVALDGLHSQSSSWWVAGKLTTYAMQQEPFLHIDADVFLWRPLPERLQSATLMAQHPEDFTAGDPASYYHPELVDALIEQHRGWLPPCWRLASVGAARRRAVCCGILGGSDVAFLNGYAREALLTLKHPRNQEAWRQLPQPEAHNVLFEQYLLWAHLSHTRTVQGSPLPEFEYLFPSLEAAFTPSYAAKAGFTHLMGSAKHKTKILDRLRRRVTEISPRYADRARRISAALGDPP